MNLVFASGFLLPQRVGKIDYFNGVKALVESKGHRPLFHVVPPLGKSKVRADLLAKVIQGAFPTGPIHIIGHSMGGLDSCYMIAADHPGLSGRIVSLTTLSTPHRGSPVADLLAGGRPGFFSFLRRRVYDAISEAIGGLKIIETGAIGDLTEEGARAVPNVATTHPQISYRSYAASGRPGALPTSLLLLAPYEYILSANDGGPNDGAVAVKSAKCGDFQETWACDHLDMVGHDLDDPLLGPPKFKHLVEIDKIISKLQTEHPGT